MDPAYTDKLLDTLNLAATSPGSEHKAVLFRVYAGIIEGNFDALREAAASHVEFTISGFEPMAGTWRGHDAVVQATKTNFAQVGSQKPVIEGMIADGDSVAVMIRESGVMQATGQPYLVRAVQWFTFSEGKIVRIDQVVASIPTV